jgi:hypothetical protein
MVLAKLAVSADLDAIIEAVKAPWLGYSEMAECSR